jgi:hypothetical protein
MNRGIREITVTMGSKKSKAPRVELSLIKGKKGRIFQLVA